MTPGREMGPPGNGGRVAVIGGGPGGAGCALALLRMARRLGRQIEVVLFEPKEFGAHYNQCAGVLSPPIQETLRAELGIALPRDMFQRRIVAYALHSEHDAIRLPIDEGGEQTFAIRRVELDRFLLQSAEEAGASVIRSRAYDVEFDAGGVTVYCDSGSHRADVLVGAFGLEPTMAGALARRTGYQAPPCLEAVVAKLHPATLDPIPHLLDDTIHAFLPALGPVDFGALIPKGNHITVIMAGERVTVPVMKEFLHLPEVAKLLPERYEAEHFFKGTFPIGLAKRSFGDRYVTVGDAAGLVRPFKGKGIYSGLLTGIRAARTILEVGTSERAFRHFYEACSELTRDVRYGRLVRVAALMVSKRLSLDPVVALAKRDAELRRALFLAVSGDGTYRNIVLSSARPKLVADFLLTTAGYYLGGRPGRPVEVER